jgi:membrane protease YdiL (CAAX protease family)
MSEMNSDNLKKGLAFVEILLMVFVVAFDILLPSLLIVIIGFLFLIIRQEKLPFFKQKIWQKPFRLVLYSLGLAIAISMIDYGFIIPILNHLTRSTQDMQTFSELKGNSAMMLFLLAYSWTLAAVGEEFAYRGFFQNRIISLFQNGTVGTIIAVVSTSLLFGIMHKEQGIAGMISTSIDAVLLSIVRYRYKNIWASVLVHGFINTIGIVTFYFTGPLNGLW